MWDAIHTFVKKIVNYHYTNDESIKEDIELQAFAKELKEVRTIQSEGLLFSHFSLA